MSTRQQNSKSINYVFNKFNKNNIKWLAWSIIRSVLILGISFIILRPILVKISSAVMSEADLFDRTVMWIPRNYTLVNFQIVWEALDYPRAFLNSFVLASGVSFLQLLSCTLIGYGLARFEFKGVKLLFGIVIFMLIVPPQVIIIPLYMNFRFFDIFGIFKYIFGSSLNFINTYWPFLLMGLTGTGVRNGLYIYIMRQFFRGMPRDLEEAAYVDGAGPYKTFFKVMLPGALPAIIIVFLFSFVWQWNDNYFTQILLGSKNLLANNISNLAQIIAGENITRISRQEFSMINNTGSLLFIAPLLLLYGFMQRYFIESVERTGIVG